MSNETVLRFNEVNFEYLHKKPILTDANFSVREGSKVTLMGQNGAGKSTILKLITGEDKPKSGAVNIKQGSTIGTAKQVIDKSDHELTVEKYFEKSYGENVPYNMRGEMQKVMDAVNLTIPADRQVKDLSGGQQARLLLAYALIQHPDILLLDEPTNNLDKAGIDHLIEFLIMYDKTVLVISHDADFLNCFTDGVIYLDVFTHKTEQYVGDYYSVVDEISQRVEREHRKNAQLERNIQDRKEKVNFFANKGGKMRKLAKKLREEVEEDEANKVDVRREDKAIRDFEIEAQDIVGEIVKINFLKVVKNNKLTDVPFDLILRKRQRLLVKGKNGIGKSTFLRNLAANQYDGAKVLDGVKIGYYSQDFGGLNFGQTALESLEEACTSGMTEQEIRSVASGFLITGELTARLVGELSEGQKGLLSFARLTLMKPGLLILDEPSNHINFRHLPIIIKALDNYNGTMIMVSHMEDFVSQIRVDEEIDFNKLSL